MNFQINEAKWIKIFAVMTAIPRWTGALLASEGFEIPETWLVLWIPMSALLSAGMAAVEAWAFAFVFTSWRNQTDKRANRLFGLAVLSAVVFIFVLAPYIGSRVRDVTIAEILTNDVAFWLWSIAVGASTITIIISVGYAQRQDKTTKTTRAKKTIVDPIRCWCGNAAATKQGHSAHTKRHKNEIKNAPTIPDALKILQDAYPGASVRPSIVRKLRKDFGNEKNDQSQPTEK
jgi:hypothetical protein